MRGMSPLAGSWQGLPRTTTFPRSTGECSLKRQRDLDYHASRGAEAHHVLPCGASVPNQRLGCGSGAPPPLLPTGTLVSPRPSGGAAVSGFLPPPVQALRAKLSTKTMLQTYLPIGATVEGPHGGALRCQTRKLQKTDPQKNRILGGEEKTIRTHAR